MPEPIHELFDTAADRFSERTAIEWQDRRISYRELQDRANELAHRLRRAGVESSELVAILSARTPDVIAGILGTLKAGGAFMPLDTAFQVARLETVVAEVRPRFWLVDSDYATEPRRLDGLAGLGAEVIPLEEGWLGPGSVRRVRPLAPALKRDPEGMCYLYMTSGSTGRPKGIAGRLKAIDHFIRWETEVLGLTSDCRVSQLTSVAFDASLRDVFAPLVCGGTVCVPPGREVVLDGGRLAEWIDRARLSLVHCTPSIFRSLLNQTLSPSRFSTLRHVLLAGEPLRPLDVKRWYSVFGDRVQLVNLYGPSETTLVKFFYLVRPEDGDAPSIPIGKPMPGTKALVVDEKQQPCPPGRLGEIYIRTQYCSLGYFNQPELTAEAFIQNPFSDRPDDIVYKTGDLGRLRDDGNFEFVGRRDQQVKVRGVRVELAPIEEAIRSHIGVAEAVVADRTDLQGNKYLCAYAVLSAQVETAELLRYLGERLPEAMIPSAFVYLEALPRTLSGKVDRRALPSPGQAGGRSGAEYVPPRTPVEESLCLIFSELLGVVRIGIRDSFLESGGHSLLAMQLLARIRSAFGVEVQLPQVIETPTVEGLALEVIRLQGEQESEESIAALIHEIEGLQEEELDIMILREAHRPAGE